MQQRSLRDGRELCTKDEFMALASEDANLPALFKDWVDSGRRQRLAPSVDRIDHTKGYTIDNIQFITCGANSSKGQFESRHIRNPVRVTRGIIQMVFPSIHALEKAKLIDHHTFAKRLSPDNTLSYKGWVFELI